jgi:hypothetical protein
METGVLVNLSGEPIYWHLPPERTGGSLPDSKDLWDVIWKNRNDLEGFAHSHPGSGTPGPSHTDVTTFAAVEAALGRRLSWWITSSDALVVVWWTGPDRLSYKAHRVHQQDEQSWIADLRRLSDEAEWAQKWAEKETEVGGFPGVTGRRTSERE